MPEQAAPAGAWTRTEQDGPFVRATLREWVEQTGQERLPQWARLDRAPHHEIEVARHRAAAAALARIQALVEQGSTEEIAHAVGEIELGRYATGAQAWDLSVGTLPTLDGGRARERASVWLRAARMTAVLEHTETRAAAMHAALHRSIELSATAWSLTPSFHDLHAPPAENVVVPALRADAESEWRAIGELMAAAEARTEEAFTRARFAERSPRGPALRREARTAASDALDCFSPALVELPGRAAEVNRDGCFVTRETLHCLAEHAWKTTRSASGDRQQRDLEESCGRAWAAWSAALFLVRRLIAGAVAAAPAPPP